MFLKLKKKLSKEKVDIDTLIPSVNEEEKKLQNIFLYFKLKKRPLSKHVSNSSITWSNLKQ